jgi:putative serine protease PepD
VSWVSMTPHRNRTALAVGACAIALGGAAVGAVARDATTSSGTTTVVRTSTPASAASSPVASKTLSVNQIYRAASSGVVEITATTTSSSGSPFPFGGGSGSSQSSAVGSGFVYDSAGHIVTNQHVVDGATSVTVRFANGTKLKATVVGTDSSTDLAVLKVSSLPSGVTPLSLGSSSTLEVGDGVVAIGSPFGLEGTVTSGIVSALGREITAPDGYTIPGAIQTDAAINPGNSGGPLLDLEGKVVGVTSQIESDSGGNDGVGFAVPSDTVRTIASQLIAGRTVTHAYLGVRIADASGGARVTLVQSGSPASTAGLRVGDVIVRADGKSIASADALRAAVDASTPGKSMTLEVHRSGATKTLHATLGTRPAA